MISTVSHTAFLSQSVRISDVQKLLDEWHATRLSAPDALLHFPRGSQVSPSESRTSEVFAYRAEKWDKTKRLLGDTKPATGSGERMIKIENEWKSWAKREKVNQSTIDHDRLLERLPKKKLLLGVIQAMGTAFLFCQLGLCTNQHRCTASCGCAACCAEKARLSNYSKLFPGLE